MVLSGAEILRNNVNNVNALNVFPVPDGDTGTNMNLTMTSGVEEIRRKPSDHVGRAADALSKGLLMGARGNSGVILSQLFRGFAKSVQNLETVNPQQFAAALQQGVETAYKAVVKPVEGTILTVAKETAKQAQVYARRTNDVAELMKVVYENSQQALDRTPDLLPVLKQVGVVDSGGQGLVFVYEGFLRALTDSVPAYTAPAASAAPIATLVSESAHNRGHEGKTAQSMLATEDIEQGYCTEFIIKLLPGKTADYVFDEQSFRGDLSKMGDSLLVVADEDLVKIHIHAEYPGSVMNHAMKYGDLTRIKIENMREQHTHILETSEYDLQYAAAGGLQDTISQEITAEIPVTAGDIGAGFEANEAAAAFGFVAVAMGDGIAEILQSLGVNEVISGGQTMNPSTEDIVNAVNRVHAETVFVFPNNSNIVMAARQAQNLIEDKTVIVIPTKTIPQGMAALIAFQETADADSNTETMNHAVSQIVSGQVTYAVRDTSIDGVDIKEGDFIGICEGKIVVSEPDLSSASQGLIDQMMANGGEIITVLTGEDATDEQTAALASYVKAQYPQVDVEIHAGGQPVYVYLFAVE